MSGGGIDIAEALDGDVLLTVIAPCFNESGNIETLARRVLDTVDRMGIRAELVLIDDGSADVTWERIEEVAGHDARVRGVRRERNGGIEAAWRTGLTAARGRLVCLIDSDLQNRPEDIARLLDAYRGGEGLIVQAVRHSVGAGQRARLFTRGLNGMLNRSFGTSLRDNKSGFLLCSRETLADMLRHRWRYRFYQCFVGVAAVRRGHAVVEVDTVFESRHAGESFLPQVPIRVTMSIVWELLKFRVETWLFGWNAPSVETVAAEPDPQLA